MTYEELVEENKKLNIKLQNAELELTALRRIVFGSKRENTPVNKEQLVDSDQCSLFETEKEADENLEKQEKEKIEEIVVHRKKNNKKKQAGIKRNALKNVVIEKEDYVLKEDEKCPICNGNLKVVGKELVRQEIEFEPAKFKIKQIVQYTYKCEECGTDKSENPNSTFVKAPIPKALLTHSFISPSLATEVIYQKYCLGVPLYRQEKMWDDKGLVLLRNMMANWNIKLTEYYFEPLYELMLNDIKKNSELLHSDETTMQCNKEPGRKATSNSYMWVLRSGELEQNKGVIFKYSSSRSAETASEYLKGFKGVLVTDGYAGYNNIEGIIHAECWAHARRYFYESVPLKDNKEMDTTAEGFKGVEYCDKLFKIEREIALLSMQEKLEVRQSQSKKILEEFFAWVLQTSEKIIVNNKLKKAITYALNQKKELSEFLNDARIPLSNSLAERAIRPFAVHRKNWLFADSVAGAKANAVIYSLVESAKANKLNVYKYIKYLLDNLPQIENINDEESLSKYLPWSKELPTEILNCECAESEDPVVAAEQ